MPQLAHKSRRGRGIPTEQHWVTLSKPVQKAMTDLYGAVEPAIDELLKVCPAGTSALRDGLLQRCCEAIDNFATEVIRKTTHLEGPSRQPPPKRSRRRASGVQGRRVAEEELAAHVVYDVAKKLDAVRSTTLDGSIQWAVSLDSADEASVKWVLHRVLSVLHGADAARSRLRTFKLSSPGRTASQRGCR